MLTVVFVIIDFVLGFKDALLPYSKLINIFGLDDVNSFKIAKFWKYLVVDFFLCFRQDGRSNVACI